MTSDAASRLTIADHYRRMITSSELADGAALPSVLEIADQHRVSKDVVTRALRLLQNDGLIRVGRRGAYVTYRPTASLGPRANAEAVKSTGKIYPETDHARILSAALVPAPDYVAEALDIEAADPVVRRVRVRYSKDRPMAYSVSWIPAPMAKLVPELLVADRIQGGTIGRIQEVTGRGVTGGIDDVAGRGAPVEVARELGLGEGAPILAGCNLWVDDQGQPVEFGEFFVPADTKIRYHYEV